MTRKAPHTRARSGPGISTAARAPMIAPNTPPPPIHSAGRRRTLPSRMWVMPPTIAVGTMATREVPWATAWDAPKPTVMVGTNSSPPPMPMVPLRKPAPKPPATAITSGQFTGAQAPSGRGRRRSRDGPGGRLFGRAGRRLWLTRHDRVVPERDVRRHRPGGLFGLLLFLLLATLLVSTFTHGAQFP